MHNFAGFRRIGRRQHIDKMTDEMEQPSTIGQQGPKSLKKAQQAVWCGGVMMTAKESRSETVKGTKKPSI
jgi:hypothetical protein